MLINKFYVWNLNESYLFFKKPVNFKHLNYENFN